MSFSPEIPTTAFREPSLTAAFSVRGFACGLFLITFTAQAESPTSIFAPAATPAHSIYGLSMLVLSITAMLQPRLLESLMASWARLVEGMLRSAH